MNGKQAILLARKLRKEQTEAEACFWKKVRNRQIQNFKFFRQDIVEFELIENKTKCFIADFYQSQSKLIIELDGGIHNHKKEYDLDRTEILEVLEFSVIRFSNEDVIAHWDKVEQELLSSIYCNKYDNSSQPPLPEEEQVQRKRIGHSLLISNEMIKQSNFPLR